MMRRTHLPPLSTAALLALAACMAGGSAPLAQDLLRIEEREDAYHASATASDDPDEIQGEASAYASDMHGLMDDMMDTCEAMMDGGSIDEDAHDAVAALAVDMGHAIDHHVGDVQSAEDAADMHEMCDEHHDDMTDDLDAMDDRVGQMGDEDGGCHCCGSGGGMM